MKVKVRVKPSAFKSNLARDAYSEILYQENRDLRRKLQLAEEDGEFWHLRFSQENEACTELRRQLMDAKEENASLDKRIFDLETAVGELQLENEDIQNTCGNACAERDALVNEQEMLYKKIEELETKLANSQHASTKLAGFLMDMTAERDDARHEAYNLRTELADRDERIHILEQKIEFNRELTKSPLASVATDVHEAELFYPTKPNEST